VTPSSATTAFTVACGTAAPRASRVIWSGAEKYLKALLVAQGLRFLRTYDLTALSDRCLRNGIDIRVDQDALERLAAYAIEVSAIQMRIRVSMKRARPCR
jgi:hypothetical protein